MSILINVLIAFHVLVCLLMVVVVLMQRPKNEGLGAAFGGGMTENIFGAQTTHVLQKFTVWLGIVFFALTLLLAILYAKRGTGETVIQKELLGQPSPVVTPGASPAAEPSPSPIVATTEAVEVPPVAAGDASSSPTVRTLEVTTEAVAVPQAAPTAGSSPDQTAEPVPAATAPPSPAGN